MPMALPEGGISLEALEKDLILQALKKSAGNQTRAARYLNMSRRALAYRLEKYDVDADIGKPKTKTRGAPVGPRACPVRHSKVHHNFEFHSF